MINPFTIESKISRLQQEVLQPLYSLHGDQEKMQYDWLLVLTGRVIESNRLFLEELAESRLVAAAFKVVKFLGGAESLTEEDFSRFTSYINDGGLKAMVKMLLAADKEKVFLAELKALPAQVRKNAPQMLTRSAALHDEYINNLFKDRYGSLQATPDKLVDNFHKSTKFIQRLARISHQ